MVANLYWYQAEVARVIDGDTICLFVDLGFNRVLEYPEPSTFRILDLDTYETTRRIRNGKKVSAAEVVKGKEARDYARELLGDKTVWVRTVKSGSNRGKYTRYCAEIWCPVSSQYEVQYCLFAALMEKYDRNKYPL